mgnify:CR=1 FL=1
MGGLCADLYGIDSQLQPLGLTHLSLDDLVAIEVAIHQVVASNKPHPKGREGGAEV